MIRAYRKEDFEAVLSLFDQLSPHFFHPDERIDLENYLGNQVEDYFVWEENGSILASGGLNYFPKQSQIRISWDMVAKDFHGRKIGMQMLHFRLKLAEKRHGYKQVVVRTSQHAWKFYEKAGFELQEQVKDFWASGFDLFLMIKAINT